MDLHTLTPERGRKSRTSRPTLPQRLPRRVEDRGSLAEGPPGLVPWRGPQHWKYFPAYSEELRARAGHPYHGGRPGPSHQHTRRCWQTARLLKGARRRTPAGASEGARKSPKSVSSSSTARRDRRAATVRGELASGETTIRGRCQP